VCFRMAIIIEGALENWEDLGILLAINLLNASISFHETTKAGDAVAALKVMLKPNEKALGHLDS
jgi:H+-transporting ATPase